jgi:hypothetical protein
VNFSLLSPDFPADINHQSDEKYQNGLDYYGGPEDDTHLFVGEKEQRKGISLFFLRTNGNQRFLSHHPVHRVEKEILIP